MSKHTQDFLSQLDRADLLNLIAIDRAIKADLLEALGLLLGIAEIHFGNRDDIANVVMDKARAAIAKATK